MVSRWSNSENCSFSTGGLSPHRLEDPQGQPADLDLRSTGWRLRRSHRESMRGLHRTRKHDQSDESKDEQGGIGQKKSYRGEQDPGLGSASGIAARATSS